MPSDLINPTPFLYKRHVFICAVRLTDRGLYQAVVLCQRSEEEGGVLELPFDADPYGTAVEALRHAEQQAVRWTHDKLGEGRARF